MQKEIVRLVRRAADPAAFDEANSQYGNAKGATNQESTTSAAQGEETESLEEKVRRTVTSLAAGEVAENQEVQNSGMGKKPKFDFQLHVGSRPSDRVSVICQIERYWNPTSVDLLRRRLERALQSSTDVSGAIVVVPRPGRDTVKAALNDDKKVLLVSPEDFDDQAAIEKKLRAFIRDLSTSAT
ncbi:hypothetical protein [Clavibacter tessellarius]|uniref:hypothetical protein n=1 Tax=Clavibacter tessellarius TaxID=31965 RepID=UPI0032469CFE